ncbi:short-chain dehydrogenase [Solibacillus sp. FSL H8-0538]|uniref:short-chain dehydrogenase n=1 Tax=Solibacillus sp. FSL H8-0538 TaxID=2921400 RepID=UPI0030F73ED9
MGIWLYPAIFVVLIICIVAYYLTVSVAHNVEDSGREMDTPIPESLKNHPFILNPIILMYIIAGLFSGIMIFYYWSTSSSY